MMISFRNSLIAMGTAVGLAGAAFAGPVDVPPGDIPFGVYDPDGDFMAKNPVVVEHLFLPWEDVFLPSLNDADEYARERNRALLVTLEPWTWSRDERNTAQYLRRGIERGEYDPNMTAVCQVLGTLKSPVTLRFAHEMDDESGQFIWSGWNPDTYISAYRHMIDLCRESAPNITVMWSPLGNEDMGDYYPGDDYADLIGLTVFGLQTWDQAKYGGDRTFDDIFAPRYERAAIYGKPVVVAELGYVGKEDYVEMWKQSVRAEKTQYPNLVGVFYFNQREVYPWPENFGAPDWRIKNQVLN
ncbi:glycoside hydrolase family 26 protein [Celeribacter litoreus]|uniref:glycoside hydrolase family 26 protein n=1 Tax=Celeribacter litoreus TaxID=2876714 RepID=UPI001CCB0A19|nr:glycosyl hydrolase [Celeribacter litoreus]MCA0045102.1 beta-mannosidase [Celeribacter litoreus]